jgi:hypothetical protein
MSTAPDVGQFSNARTWLRRCRHEWSHFVIRSIVLHCDDGWRALWTDVVLMDSGAVPRSEVSNIEKAKDVTLIEATHPVGDLFGLLPQLRRGTLPSRFHQNSRVGEEPVALSWHPSHAPSHQPFKTVSSPEFYLPKRPFVAAREWNTYPHGQLTFSIDNPGTWANGGTGRYSWLESIDDQVRRTGCRSLCDLGVRIGLLSKNAGDSASASVTPHLQIIAPHYVRTGSVTFDRYTGALTIGIERSGALVDHNLAVSVVNGHGVARQIDPIQVPRGGRSPSVIVDDVDSTEIEVALHDDVLDTFVKRQGMLKARYRRSARSALGAVVKGGYEPLRRSLLDLEGRNFEGPLRQLLFLLGYSTWGLDPDWPQPPELPRDTLKVDVLAFSSTDRTLLVVECSSDFFGTEKLAKLVTRSKELGLYLQGVMAGDDVPQVQPVVAVTRKRAIAPKNLIDAARAHDVGLLASVITSKPAIRDRVKTGHTRSGRDRFI